MWGGGGGVQGMRGMHIYYSGSSVWYGRDAFLFFYLHVVRGDARQSLRLHGSGWGVYISIGCATRDVEGACPSLKLQVVVVYYWAGGGYAGCEGC